MKQQDRTAAYLQMWDLLRPEFQETLEKIAAHVKSATGLDPTSEIGQGGDEEFRLYLNWDNSTDGMGIVGVDLILADRVAREGEEEDGNDEDLGDFAIQLNVEGYAGEYIASLILRNHTTGLYTSDVDELKQRLAELLTHIPTFVNLIHARLKPFPPIERPRG